MKSLIQIFIDIKAENIKNMSVFTDVIFCLFILPYKDIYMNLTSNLFVCSVKYWVILMYYFGLCFLIWSYSGP